MSSHSEAFRVPVSLFERVEGCFACENRAGLPIPVSEFPEDGDIGLCQRHWNWWLMRFARLAPDSDPSEPPCAAHLLAYGTSVQERKPHPLGPNVVEYMGVDL